MGRHIVSASGESGEQKDGGLARWKPIDEMVTLNINFAIATGGLEDRRKEREEIDDSDNSDNRKNEQQQSSWKCRQGSEG